MTDKQIELKPETLGGMIADMYRGQPWFVTVWTNAFAVGMTVLAVFAALRFFEAESLREWILYATLWLTAIVYIALIKVWYWLRWLRNSTVRQLQKG